MMNLFLANLVLVTVLGTSLVRCRVSVQNGGYTNVLVSFAQNVNGEDGRTAVQLLQNQLNEASRILHSAIGVRIADVTVVIPRSWDTTGWEQQVQPSSTRRDEKADMLVVSANSSVLGHFPHTVQYGPCGTPGHQIVIPTDFIVGEKTTYPKGTAIAREWLKYRYGVFDENGYFDDEVYPLYYRIPGLDDGEAIVTSCSNHQIEYEFYDGVNNCSKEELFSKVCTPEPTEDSLQNVTSSMMFFHEHIPQMQHVCGRNDDHPHSSLARNKHNALCRGQSVWQVLANSTDFQQSQHSTSADGGLEEVDPVKFSLVREPRQKVVIAWENTAKMAQQGETVLNAVRRFVYDLPKDTKRALYPFIDKFDETNSVGLSELVNWPQDWRFELKSTFSYPSEGCTKCALVSALDVLDADPSDLGEESIILIGASKLERDESLLQRIKNSNRCLILLVLSEETLEHYQELAQASTCGSLVQISQTFSKIEVIQILFANMESILPETVDDAATQTVETSILESGKPLEINVDSSTQKVAFWIFGEIDVGSIFVTYNASEGSKINLREEISEKLLEYTFAPENKGALIFKLTYGPNVLVQVRVTSSPGEYVRGDIFVRDPTKDSAPNQEPVVLYAKVYYGIYPVQNADVIATITRPGDEAVTLKLLDTGTGDPDITANDGLYSRYFTQFTSEGYYIVSIEVKGNEQTKIGKITDGESPLTCCGASAKEGSPLPHSFTKTFQTAFHAKAGRPENGYPPSRIVDLRVGKATEKDITLVWTAPGGEADSGTADTYAIKYFETSEIKDFEEGKLLNQASAKEWGSKEEIVIEKKLFENEGHFFIAVRATRGNTSSELSNVIEVHVLKGDLEDPDSRAKQSAAHKNTIIIVCSILAGIVVLSILVYMLFVRSGRSESKKASREMLESNNHQQANKDSSMNPVTFVPIDTLIKHHNDKTRAKLEHKEAPILREKDFEQSPRNATDTVAYVNEMQENHSTADETELERISYPPKSPKRTTHV